MSSSGRDAQRQTDLVCRGAPAILSARPSASAWAAICDLHRSSRDARGKLVGPLVDAARPGALPGLDVSIRFRELVGRISQEEPQPGLAPRSSLIPEPRRGRSRPAGATSRGDLASRMRSIFRPTWTRIRGRPESGTGAAPPHPSESPPERRRDHGPSACWRGRFSKTFLGPPDLALDGRPLLLGGDASSRLEVNGRPDHGRTHPPPRRDLERTSFCTVFALAAKIRAEELLLGRELVLVLGAGPCRRGCRRGPTLLPIRQKRPASRRRFAEASGARDVRTVGA